MKKILFPTDFSAPSLNAFRYALEMAAHLEAEIITLHIYQLPVIGQDMELTGSQYLFETYNILELGSFENFKGQIPLIRKIADEMNLSHVKISNALEEGDLVAGIKAYIKNERIDFVVMSTKGASGMEEVFLGTTTAKIMASANAIVIGIPEASAFKKISNIGFATNFKPEEIKPLKKLIAIAETMNATVNCIYVKTPGSKINEVVVADWELNFRDKVRFSFPEANTVEAGILDFTEKNQIDLLAMLTHKHGFFENLFHESRTKKMACHTNIPLMALHEL